MKKIGFIGAQDKTDLIISVAKVLATLNQRVLIIDGTVTQKAKYVVPTIHPTKTYLTTIENIDVAVGFETLDHLQGYLGITLTQNSDYDIVLLDIDTPETFRDFMLEESDINFFVTAFDMYTLRKGLEVLTAAQVNIELIKILYVKKLAKEDEPYLNFLSQNYPITWNEDTIYYIYDETDEEAFADNQRVGRIKFRNLSSGYKSGLISIINRIYPNYKINDLSKLMKNIDRGV